MENSRWFADQHGDVQREVRRIVEEETRQLLSSLERQNGFLIDANHTLCEQLVAEKNAREDDKRKYHRELRESEQCEEARVEELIEKHSGKILRLKHRHRVECDQKDAQIRDQQTRILGLLGALCSCLNKITQML